MINGVDMTVLLVFKTCQRAHEASELSCAVVVLRIHSTVFTPAANETVSHTRTMFDAVPCVRFPARSRRWPRHSQDQNYVRPRTLTRLYSTSAEVRSRQRLKRGMTIDIKFGSRLTDVRSYSADHLQLLNVLTRGARAWGAVSVYRP
jgi:hypothetical protein